MKNRKFAGQVDLLNGPVFSSLIIFAIPILLSNIFQQLYNTMDTVIVGYALGETSLAAIGSATPVYDLLIGFVLGFGNGLSIVAGKYFGMGNTEKLKRSVAGSLLIGAAVSILITVLTRFLLRPLLVLLNTPSEVLDEAFGYISIITLFTFVMFAYNLCAGMLRAVGNSTAPLIFLIFSSALNIALDLFFIVRLHMGVNGAAAATVIAQCISVVLCIVYIWKKADLLIPKKQHFRVGKAIFADLTAQGFSLGFMQSLVAIGSVILQFGINGLGYLVIAAHTAARKLFLFSIMPIFAFQTAVSAFVSQNYGAGRPDRIRKGMKSAYLFDAGSTVVIALILIIGAPFLMRLISGSDETVVLEYGTRYLRFAAPFYVVLGLLCDTRIGLQAIGKKILPIISSFIELAGKIVFTLVFIPIFAYSAVIVCEPVLWCLMTVELLIAFWRNPYIRNAKIN